jgi:UTP--glucose-1-phosphate uridylyltransferase
MRRAAIFALLIAFPIAWAAPLMRAAILPIFGMQEISILSGLVELWRSDIWLAAVVTLFAIIAPYAKLLAMLAQTNMDSGAIAYVRQHRALGLGHAVWCARQLIGDRPFAVILPDDVIAAEKPCLLQMAEAFEDLGGSMVATMEVPPEKASSYGILDIAQDRGTLVDVKGLVEKPKPQDAPSNLAVIGRYILTPDVLTTLDRMQTGAGGEIQLTDAIAAEIAAGRKVHGYRFRGQRYDCGSKAGFLQATVAFGLAREDLRDEFAMFLRALMAQRAP